MAVSSDVHGELKGGRCNTVSTGTDNLAEVSREIRVHVQPSLARQLRILAASVIVVVLCASLAYNVERSFGKVDVQQVRIAHPSGAVIVGKLYRPVAATPQNKLPGVLAIHGYQNDKDTQDAFAIELSRRGFVVLAIDMLGHGSSGGYLTQRAQDASIGGDSAYKYLKSLPFVDGNNLGVMGHSLGAIATLAVGAANPDHKALNPQCGTAGAPALHNVLLTQARFEEFRLFRENQGRVEGLDKDPNRAKAFGLAVPVEWNTTYGDFSTGTARRQALIDTVHPGITHSSKAVAEALEWMRLALKQGRTDSYWIPPNNQIYMWKEWLTLIALLATLFSIIPLTNILLSRRYFSEVTQPMPARYAAKPKAWWGFAIVNVLIGAATYPYITSKVNNWAPYGSLFRLGMGNGLAAWLVTCAAIALVLFLVWYNTSGRKSGVTMYDMGVSFDQDKTVVNWRVVGKTALLAILLFLWMYALVAVAGWMLGVEFRFLWPFMRTFTPRRFGYFLVYLVPFLLFFLVNGGVFLFGQARQPEYGSAARTTWIWWLKNSFVLVFGLVIVWAVQYVPYLFMGMPPGFEAMGFPQFGQMWPLMTMVYVPEFLPLVFLLTWFYRRTGKIYLGSFVVAAITVWFLAAGSVIV